LCARKMPSVTIVLLLFSYTWELLNKSFYLFIYLFYLLKSTAGTPYDKSARFR
jgi:hypothetical protein